MLHNALVIRWTSAPALTSTTDGSWVTEKLSASSCIHAELLDRCNEKLQQGISQTTGCCLTTASSTSTTAKATCSAM